MKKRPFVEFHPAIVEYSMMGLNTVAYPTERYDVLRGHYEDAMTDALESEGLIHRYRSLINVEHGSFKADGLHGHYIIGDEGVPFLWWTRRKSYIIADVVSEPQFAKCPRMGDLRSAPEHMFLSKLKYDGLEILVHDNKYLMPLQRAASRISGKIGENVNVSSSQILQSPLKVLL